MKQNFTRCLCCKKEPNTCGAYKEYSRQAIIDCGRFESTCKPPIGIKPQNIHNEERLIEINRAILEYTIDGKEYPKMWDIEYRELVEYFRIRREVV